MKTLRFITNMSPDSYGWLPDPQEAKRKRDEVLRGRVVGPPKGSEHYSVAELARMGLYGVYEVVDLDETKNSEVTWWQRVIAWVTTTFRNIAGR